MKLRSLESEKISSLSTGHHYECCNVPSSAKKCKSTVVQEIDAPISVVWSIVRNFKKPQTYKRFVKSVSLITGNGDVGSVREVHLVSGLPAEISVERLDVLDEKLHIISYNIIGGDHQLLNYHATMVLEENKDNPGKTIVMESYLVDVLPNNTCEDTCCFINNIIKWNLESLALVATRKL